MAHLNGFKWLRPTSLHEYVSWLKKNGLWRVVKAHACAVLPLRVADVPSLLSVDTFWVWTVEQPPAFCRKKVTYGPMRARAADLTVISRTL